MLLRERTLLAVLAAFSALDLPRIAVMAAPQHQLSAAGAVAQQTRLIQRRQSAMAPSIPHRG